VARARAVAAVALAVAEHHQRPKWRRLRRSWRETQLSKPLVLTKVFDHDAVTPYNFPNNANGSIG
jgi:hypothetical protein